MSEFYSQSSIASGLSQLGGSVGDLENHGEDETPFSRRQRFASRMLDGRPAQSDGAILSPSSIAAYLIGKSYLLTALEYYTELREDGIDMREIRDYFENLENFESRLGRYDLDVHKSPRATETQTTASETLSSMDNNDQVSNSEVGEVIREKDEYIAVLEYELRQVKDSAAKLQQKLSAVLKFGTSGPGVDQPIPYTTSPYPMNPPPEAEGKIVNFLIHDYLKSNGYKMTALTFIDENENQNLENWEELTGLPRDLFPPPAPLRRMFSSSSSDAAKPAITVSSVPVSAVTPTDLTMSMNSEAAANIQLASPSKKQTMDLVDSPLSITDFLSDNVVNLIQSVVINKRDEFLPLLCAVIQQSESEQTRSILICQLLNIVKKPSVKQRKNIVNACIRLSSSYRDEIIRELREFVKTSIVEKKRLAIDIFTHIQQGLQGIELVQAVLMDSNPASRIAAYECLSRLISSTSTSNLELIFKALSNCIGDDDEQAANYLLYRLFPEFLGSCALKDAQFFNGIYLELLTYILENVNNSTVSELVSRRLLILELTVQHIPITGDFAISDILKTIHIIAETVKSRDNNIVEFEIVQLYFVFAQKFGPKCEGFQQTFSNFVPTPSLLSVYVNCFLMSKKETSSAVPEIYESILLNIAGEKNGWHRNDIVDMAKSIKHTLLLHQKRLSSEVLLDVFLKLIPSTDVGLRQLLPDIIRAVASLIPLNLLVKRIMPSLHALANDQDRDVRLASINAYTVILEYHGSQTEVLEMAQLQLNSFLEDPFIEICLGVIKLYAEVIKFVQEDFRHTVIIPGLMRWATFTLSKSTPTSNSENLQHLRVIDSALAIFGNLSSSLIPKAVIDNYIVPTLVAIQKEIPPLLAGDTPSTDASLKLYYQAVEKCQSTASSLILSYSPNNSSIGQPLPVEKKDLPPKMPTTAPAPKRFENFLRLLNRPLSMSSKSFSPVQGSLLKNTVAITPTQEKTASEFIPSPLFAENTSSQISSPSAAPERVPSPTITAITLVETPDVAPKSPPLDKRKNYFDFE